MIHGVMRTKIGIGAGFVQRLTRFPCLRGNIYPALECYLSLKRRVIVQILL